ncbi:MAG: deoxyribonuclease IV [Alphaproteobacteria bacterium]|nr:deoxyribonuclease IV [Alphaproteobacteria bacterium]
MLHIGCHLSISKGFAHIGKEALSIKADTFQFFTRNPQGGKAKDIDLADVAKFRTLAAENHFAPLVAHAPYTLNPCSDNPQTREFAEMVFADDLKRMEHIPYNYYNFHPGSHVGQGAGAGIAMIIDLLNRILTAEQHTVVLLETMSGKGSEIGRSFEELAEIRAGVKLKDKLGVCLDTCHIFAAGYDIVHNLDGVMSEFDKIIGLQHLKAVHLNDSLMPLGSNKDRHAKIGAGEIGTDALIRFVNHPAVKNLPFILETPNDLAGYAAEIEFMRKNYSEYLL